MGYWHFLDTGVRRAAANMELDAALLADLKEERDAFLHLYDWELDSVTFGHFIEPENFLNMSGIKKLNIDLARRPTGGGITLHNCDLAFSVLVPAACPWFSQNPLDNYALVNNRVISAIEMLIGTQAKLLPTDSPPFDPHCRNFCMAKPTKYDVMIQGKKIGGAAQRKTRHGFLHQGSISIGFPTESYLLEILAGGTQVIEGMRQNSYTLLGSDWTHKQLLEIRKQLRHLLQKAFSNTYEG